jgi:hypothetical protein
MEVFSMELISRDELKEKLDRGDDFKLVMVLEEWAYRAKHSLLRLSPSGEGFDLYQHKLAIEIVKMSELLTSTRRRWSCGSQCDFWDL